jgi:hypothetical protein
MGGHARIGFVQLLERVGREHDCWMPDADHPIAPSATLWFNPFVPSENTEQRKLAAIMFTDMVGYSALAQRNEALALELLEEHRGLLRGLFPKHQGTEIKTTGDGFLVEFASALAAVRCAVEIQRALAERNQAQPAERQVRIRIGIHLGGVVGVRPSSDAACLPVRRTFLRPRTAALQSWGFGIVPTSPLAIRQSGVRLSLSVSRVVR